ncbi:hypothetical protein FDK38_004761 [Candidozyma auris]|nr:hypothetical protein FDK38_004761 [[Candida] auris]
MESPKTIQLDPTGGFVVKTRVLEGDAKHLLSTKVFINVCHDEKVPKPPGEFVPEKVFPLIVKNEWEIPLIVSLEKRDKDKKGVPSLVYDCCINSECFRWVQVNNDLRLILIEWCIESVELMYNMVLDRTYSFPKMLSKGELSKTEVSEEELKGGLQKKLQELKKNEVLGLLEELEPQPVEGEELPDLMNIEGKKRKPLIEEIDLMSLGKESTREMKTVSQPKKESSNSKIGPTAMEIFVGTRKLQDGKLLLKFSSPHLTPAVEMEYCKGNLSLINLNPNVYLGQKNKLEVPLPPGFEPHRVFFCNKDSTLYAIAKAV